MNQRLWGISYRIWSAVCLIPTLIWVFVWPRAEGASLSGLPFLILRWGHALTWALLSLAALLASFRSGRGTAIARGVAYLSLGVYLVFLAILMTHRP